MKKFWEVACSGILGVIVTLVFQYFFIKPQSFTFVYNGNEVVVTESTYTELVEKNKGMENNIASLEMQVRELQNELENRNNQESIVQTIENATEYWNNSEQVQALTLLKNCDLNSSDILALYQNYSEEYCEDIIKRVDGLLLERKYNEAREIILGVTDLVVNSSILEDKLIEIDNKMPCKLSSLKVSASRYLDLNTNRLVEDNVGNRYVFGNLFIVRAEGDTGYGYATFYLGKKYKSLSGTIAVSDESENRSDVQLEGWIEIYSKEGEDYRHLYTSPMLSRLTSPIVISDVDLKDSEWLEIRYYNNGDYYSLAGGYHSLEILLSDFMLYSD